MAVHFFLGAHIYRYGRLREEIKNNFPWDLNQWPEILQYVYDLVQTYRQDSKLQMRMVKKGKGLMSVTNKEDDAQKPKDMKKVKCLNVTKWDTMQENVQKRKQA